MKTRNGFVSNSSTSSFICSVCGEEYVGQDASPGDFDCSECPNGHIICNDHLKDIEELPPLTKNGCKHEFDRTKSKFCAECGEPATVEDEDEDDDFSLSERNCPVCRFEIYAEDEMASYLERTRDVTRVEVFAKVKAINKRRRKLYDSEYISHVCEKFSLTDDTLMAELKSKFKTFDEYYKFINSKKG